MSTALRQEARKFASPIEFALAFQRIWAHVEGTGFRELVRIWYRMNQVLVASEQVAIWVR